MKFSLHNKVEVNVNGKNYVYFNTVLESLLNKLANFGNFNLFLSIGTGAPNTQQQQNFKLTNYISQTTLSSKSMQSEIDKGNLFAVYEYKFKKKNINATHICELGLSENILDSANNNPTIYNYFSLISDETPNGLDISGMDEILFKVTIYLNLTENNEIILCSGKNPFIEFLLGNGIGDVYVCSGSNFTDNIRINRTINENQTLYTCTKSSNINENSLNINFQSELQCGEIDEILFVTDNRVFARQNLKNHNAVISSEITATPKTNYVIKIDDDIKSVESIKSVSDESVETNYFVSKYANSFGDEICQPFNNMFDANTTRFVSKDGKIIFFMLNSKIYAYKNEDFMIKEINTREMLDDNIYKIITISNYIFVLTETEPYISTYILSDGYIKKVNNNFKNFTHYAKFDKMYQVDIALSNDNTFMLGIITRIFNALTLYFTYSEENGFSIGNYLSNSKTFNYLLAMQGNNFCDAKIIYLKEGESSAYCRIVTHEPDKTETDIYSSLAYYLTNNTTKIYTKSRAIIAEKNISPKMIIYYYPQIYQYNLSLLSNEQANFISHDLNYIIQKGSDNSYKTYNLVGYDIPEQFTKDLSNFVDTNQISDFEFLHDTLLIFLNDNTKKIVALNFKLNKTQIENLSKTDESYKISLTKFNKLGKDNQKVKITLTTQVNL